MWEGISPRTLQEEYVGGLMVGLPPSPSIGALGLSEEDMEATLDLRRYMDPAPFATVNPPSPLVGVGGTHAGVFIIKYVFY